MIQIKGGRRLLAWLASALAQRGVLVLAVNHPGSMSGDSSPRQSLLLDERAADLVPHWIICWWIRLFRP
ncbi:hypothetical protein ACFQNF_15090 [Iodobacter arcticus]|uniref:Uncharacterized protein n=1 Tax=Iodobacter arcticus TaxID=590593 RepID=A0ABW2QZU4_9NEIS